MSTVSFESIDEDGEEREEQKPLPEHPFTVFLAPAKINKDRVWRVFMKDDEESDIRDYLGQIKGYAYHDDAPYFYCLPGYC